MTKTARRTAAAAEYARRAAGSLPIVAWRGDARACSARALALAGTERREAAAFVPGWARRAWLRSARGWLAMAHREHRPLRY